MSKHTVFKAVRQTMHDLAWILAWALVCGAYGGMVFFVSERWGLFWGISALIVAVVVGVFAINLKFASRAGAKGSEG